VCSLFTSCDNDTNDNIKRFPNAIVTIKPINGGESFNVWVSEKVQGPPSNLTKSPYGNKEVRAIANIKEEKDAKGKTKIYINWMDSIRTKQAIALKNPELELKKYGEDRLEIINGFGTVVEDGYLTLRFSTAMRDLKLKRDLNLIVQHSEKEPYKLVLAYNAHGDNRGRMASSLIAFRLSEIDKIAQKNGKRYFKFTPKRAGSVIPRSADTPEEAVESYAQAVFELGKRVGCPMSFKDHGVDYEAFKAELRQLSLDAYEDQCTPANPRLAILKDLEGIMEAAWFGYDKKKYEENK